jgi:hypothetical protein
MLDQDLLAAAYQNGQLAGRAVRWLLLLAVGFKLVRRLMSGSFGPGFRRSLPVTVIALVLVAAGLLGSLRYDFAGSASATAGPDLTAERADVVRGCIKQGQAQPVCDCYGDEVLRRTGHDPQRFTALEREMVSRQNAGQPPPQLIMDAAQYCAGQSG